MPSRTTPVHRQRPQRDRPGPPRPGAPARPDRLVGDRHRLCPCPRPPRPQLRPPGDSDRGIHPGRVQVIFLNRPIGDTPEDTLLLQLQGMFAEYERTQAAGAQPARQAASRPGRRPSAPCPALHTAIIMSAVTRATGSRASRLTRIRPGWCAEIFDWVGAERLSLAAVCRRLHAARPSQARPARRAGAGR